MKKFIYTGSNEDIDHIMDNLVNEGSGIKKNGNSLIIFTKEESRLISMGEAIIINKGKLM